MVGVFSMEGEESYSFNSLLDGTQAVRRGLEALRGEHENLLSVITQKEGFDEEHGKSNSWNYFHDNQLLVFLQRKNQMNHFF